ncbi:unnamed protein product [Angiostrongylus costaricensis]|uniref:SCP domain-containing protein n=1 Tax=Angiostrongylus costaricensis TaxID=334426 RepID=A0A0R3PHJ9_ANGCS|nr:unnamed protein product [Angiostrongylus costaricensis]
MSICTPAEGLFQTHVTWEDIEADMQREFQTAASFGQSKSAKNISDCNVSKFERYGSKCRFGECGAMPRDALIVDSSIKRHFPTTSPFRCRKIGRGLSWKNKDAGFTSVDFPQLFYRPNVQFYRLSNA